MSVFFSEVVPKHCNKTANLVCQMIIQIHYRTLKICTLTATNYMFIVLQTDQGADRFFRFQTASGQYRKEVCNLLLMMLVTIELAMLLSFLRG